MMMSGSRSGGRREDEGVWRGCCSETLMAGEYVQFGCGLCAPEAWLNFDSSPSMRLRKIPVVAMVVRRYTPDFPRNVRYGDIIRGLPVPEKSASVVYCSHVLDHLSRHDCRIALFNSFKILQPGGRFRFVLHDLEVFMDEYQDAKGTVGAAPRFMRDSILGQERRIRSIGQFLRDWLGGSQHRWLWDYPSMEAELKKVGFTNIRRAQIGDSGDPKFAAVEHPERWDRSLGIECVRPA